MFFKTGKESKEHHMRISRFCQTSQVELQGWKEPRASPGCCCYEGREPGGASPRRRLHCDEGMGGLFLGLEHLWFKGCRTRGAPVGEEPRSMTSGVSETKPRGHQKRRSQCVERISLHSLSGILQQPPWGNKDNYRTVRAFSQLGSGQCSELRQQPGGLPPSTSRR